MVKGNGTREKTGLRFKLEGMTTADFNRFMTADYDQSYLMMAHWIDAWDFEDVDTGKWLDPSRPESYDELLSWHFASIMTGLEAEVQRRASEVNTQAIELDLTGMKMKEYRLVLGKKEDTIGVLTRRVKAWKFTDKNGNALDPAQSTSYDALNIWEYMAVRDMIHAEVKRRAQNVGE